MSEPENEERPERTRHPTLWTVEGVRWEYSPETTPTGGPGVRLGQSFVCIDVPDRDLAIAIGRHFLQQHAEEAAGRMSLEIHVHPPEADLEDESVYRVDEEVIEEAKKLGIEGDVEQQVQRMARGSTNDHTNPKGNRRFERFLLKVEGNDVTWIGVVDAPRGRRRTNGRRRGT